MPQVTVDSAIEKLNLDMRRTDKAEETKKTYLSQISVLWREQTVTPNALLTGYNNLIQNHVDRHLGDKSPASFNIPIGAVASSPSFNQCRDGRLVAVMVASMMKDKARLEDIFVDKARLEAMALASDS